MATTMKLIGKQTLTGTTTSVTFSDIPGTYTDLLLLVSARTNDATSAALDEQIFLTLNSSTANFSSRLLYGSGSGVASVSNIARFAGHANNANSTSSTFSNFELYFPNYAGSTNKSWSGTSVYEHNGTNAYQVVTAGLWSNTAAITAIGLSGNSGGSFVSGSSFYLYGITKA